jgi:hypothetical protein
MSDLAKATPGDGQLKSAWTVRPASRGRVVSFGRPP